MLSLRRKIIEKKKIKPTKCGLLLLPVLGHIVELKPKGLFMREQMTKYLVDIYLIDAEQPKLVSVFDDVENEKEEEFNWLMYKLTNDFTFFDHFKDSDSGELACINQIPKDFHKDYKRFLDGKYTEFSDELKDRLIAAHGRATNNSMRDNGLPGLTVFDIINPSDRKKKQFADIIGTNVKNIKEVYDSPNIEDEIFLTYEEFRTKYE